MPLVEWKTSAWMSYASVISVYATSFCFTGLLCNILRAVWLLPASETKNTSCLHWIMEEWFVGALISREANFVFAKCKYTAWAPILTIRLCVKHERALGRSRFDVKKPYIEKTGRFKSFWPNSFRLKLLCRAEFSWNKIHPEKRALGASGPQGSQLQHKPHVSQPDA